MTRQIYDQFCKCGDWLKKQNQIINKWIVSKKCEFTIWANLLISQFKTPLTGGLILAVLFLVSLYGATKSGSISNHRMTVAQNTSFSASLDVPAHSFPSDSQENHLLPEIIKHQFKEETTLVEQQSQVLVQKPFETANTKIGEVSNIAPDISFKSKQTRLQHLIKMFKDLNRYYYFGSSPFENDLSRVELFDPLGFHEPTTVYTTVRVGNLQRMPAVLKTCTLKWGSSS